MVAELAQKLQKRARDVEKVARQAVREHADLSVLQGSLSRHASSGATTLLKPSTRLRIVSRLWSSTVVMGALPAGVGIQILGRAEADGLVALLDIPVGNRDRFRRASDSVHRQSGCPSSCSLRSYTQGKLCRRPWRFLWLW